MEMLGALTGLLGAGLSASNQAAQIGIQQEALQFQKQQARQQQRFAQAGRTDAYGNKQSFDDILNEWIIALTPTQKQITQAGEKEQLLSLTEDAPRNRRQKQRAEQTALLAGKEFEQALAGFKYDQPKSELAIKDELEQLLIGSRAQASKDNQGLLARQALRMGKGAEMSQIIKATDDALGKELPQMMLQARTGAKQERASDAQQHMATYVPQLQHWEQLMAQGGGDAALRFSNTPQEMQAVQGQMAGAIQGAMQSGASNIGGAYNALGSAVGKPVDLSAAAGAFTKGAAIQNRTAARSGAASPKYSLTANVGYKGAANPDENRQPAYNNPISDAMYEEMGKTGQYLEKMDWGDWLF